MFVMDPVAPSNIRIEEGYHSNFCSCKQKIEQILSFREVKDTIDHECFPQRPIVPEELFKWLRKDKMARITIGIKFSAEILNNVKHTTTSIDMWTEICNVHERHTLLKKLSVSVNFSIVTIHLSEEILVYINVVRKLGSI